jgi:DNA (cytosine-5)-methyltransferase 1
MQKSKDFPPYILLLRSVKVFLLLQLEKNNHFKGVHVIALLFTRERCIVNHINQHKEFLMRNIEIINDIMDTLYGSPDHGNKYDPLDELIYIHLSKKTNEKGYQTAYDRLSSAFPNWIGITEAKKKYINDLIKSAGLGNNRTDELLTNIKKIKEEFGKETLDPIRKWSDKKIFDFLTNLKGIGPKSAKCIMMYSLGRKVFPVDTHVHTICERIGFIDYKLNHKIAQEQLSEIFPKKFRYKLHVNMVAHGRKICKEHGKPLCDKCDLKKFCYYYRKNILKKINSPTMIDLFCGSGGASLGFTKSGFKIKLAIDNDLKALDTYYLNQPELTFNEIYYGDIRKFNDGFTKKLIGKIDLIIGGPPCQGWSNIGKNHKNGKNGLDFFDDERNILYLEFVKHLEYYKPKYFVMENVPGLLTAHEGKYAEIIRSDFRKHGYNSKMVILNAMDYGIPQNRKRIFFIGIRIKRDRKKYENEKKLDKIIEAIKNKKISKRISFREGIHDLPNLEPGEGFNVMKIDGYLFLKQKKEKTPVLIFNHFSRNHNIRDLTIYRLLLEGEDYDDFSKRICDSKLHPYADKSFCTKFRKINSNLPSPTIISHLSKDSNSYINPFDNRGITVREAARLQSFPDDFIFLAKGFRQFVHVGNAVPPKLAQFIGEAIIKIINNKENHV